MSKLAGVWFFDWILKNNLFNKVKISNFIHDRDLSCLNCVNCWELLKTTYYKNIEKYFECLKKLLYICT